MSRPSPRALETPAAPTVPGARPSRPRRWRRLGPVRLAVVALVVVVAVYRRWRLESLDAARYVTVAADRGPIDEVVTATGTVNPVTTVQVGTYVSGPIIAIDVDFNSPVKK